MNSFIKFNLGATINKSKNDKEMECTNNPSYEVMQLQQNQTRSDVREDVQVSDAYEYVN